MNALAAPPLLFDGPIILFGGPYSNLQALDALLAEAARRGVPPDAIVSTGDLVAYCADARAVVARVRETGVRFIRGNCEEQLAAGADDCGCGFAPGGECDRLSAGWFAHAMGELDAEDRAFLGCAPARLDLVVGGLTLSVIHGATRQTNRFVFASTPDAIKAHDLDFLGVDGIIAGHSGLPFTQTIGGRLWHNPGALGMPANEGRARVWYSVISPGAAPHSITVEHCALDYDCEGAAEAMVRAGLAPEYARTLRDGLWSNCDVLPPAEAAAQGRPLSPGVLSFARGGDCAWPDRPTPLPLAPGKFASRDATLSGEQRARVPLARLETLWINTGTLCNLACASCYIESSPRNDRLEYMSRAEVAAYLDEIDSLGLGTRTIGFTGGEPFLNRDLIGMLEDVLARGHDALVLTNAMTAMRHRRTGLLALKARYGDRLALRVSIDHYTPDLHELERGPGSFAPTLEGLVWLWREKFAVTVAGRLLSGEREAVLRAGFAQMFAEQGLGLDAFDPHALVIFPEMDARADTPEITEQCWSILGKSREDVMCASARMVVKRKGERPSVVACTLLPYEREFDLGPTLAGARGEVALNHPHCATFCVLGGASCSG